MRQGPDHGPATARACVSSCWPRTGIPSRVPEGPGPLMAPQPDPAARREHGATPRPDGRTCHGIFAHEGGLARPPRRPRSRRPGRDRARRHRRGCGRAADPPGRPPRHRQEPAADADRRGARPGLAPLQREPALLRRPRRLPGPRRARRPRLAPDAGDDLGCRGGVPRRDQPLPPGAPEQAVPDRPRAAGPGDRADPPPTPLVRDEPRGRGRRRRRVPRRRSARRRARGPVRVHRADARLAGARPRGAGAAADGGPAPGRCGGGRGLPGGGCGGEGALPGGDRRARPCLRRLRPARAPPARRCRAALLAAARRHARAGDRRGPGVGDPRTREGGPRGAPVRPAPAGVGREDQRGEDPRRAPRGARRGRGPAGRPGARAALDRGPLRADRARPRAHRPRPDAPLGCRRGRLCGPRRRGAARGRGARLRPRPRGRTPGRRGRAARLGLRPGPDPPGRARDPHRPRRPPRGVARGHARGVGPGTGTRGGAAREPARGTVGGEADRPARGRQADPGRVGTGTCPARPCRGPRPSGDADREAAA